MVVPLRDFYCWRYGAKTCSKSALIQNISEIRDEAAGSRETGTGELLIIASNPLKKHELTE